MNPRSVLAVLLLACASCAGVPPGKPGGNNCGLIAAGNIDTGMPVPELAGVLAAQLDKALDATTTTTDFRLLDMTENCSRLVGYRVYVKTAFSWPDPGGRGFNVSGLTYCGSRRIIVGTPPDGNWNKSGLVHEFFHVMQGCDAIQPPDIGRDIDHANWYRDQIYQSIERVTQ